MPQKHQHFIHMNNGKHLAVAPEYFTSQLDHLIGRRDYTEVLLFETHNAGWHIGTKKSITGKKTLTTLITHDYF